jgi:hypothetical protein
VVRDYNPAMPALVREYCSKREKLEMVNILNFGYMILIGYGCIYLTFKQDYK